MKERNISLSYRSGLKTFIFEIETRYKGIVFNINNRYRGFWWKPLADGYFDKDNVWHKAKKFQYFSWKL